MRFRNEIIAAAFSLTAALACGSTEGTQAPVPGADPAAKRGALFTKLGRSREFLIGHGNDLPGAEQDWDYTKAGVHTLPVKLDVHYVYLTGLAGEGGWADDNDGHFVTLIAGIDTERGITPMFTLYQMAAHGDGDLRGLASADFMTKYWKGVRVLFDELAHFDKPALVHAEPDFWGYAQRSAPGGDPQRVAVRVGSVVPECGDLPDDMTGFGRCLLRLGHDRAPKAAIGFHASGFGALGEPERVAEFLLKVGAAEADLVVVETLDRDAGCYEAGDQECTRDEHGAYWDETNTTHPNFHDHLDWARRVHERSGMPLFWWQLPLGVPSDVPGTARKYRDNRVRYLFEHTREFVAAGGVGAAFGPGGKNQTDITTDDGQLARYVTEYATRRVALP